MEAVDQKHLKKMRKLLFWLGFLKIPLLRYCKPKIISLNDESVSIKINLRRRTKNHLNSMYFGALSVGADVAAGILMYHFAVKNKQNISFAFKGMKAEFLKRAESDVTFKCEEGIAIQAVLKTAKETKERQNHPVKVLAYNSKNEVVAEFEMVCSVKIKD